MSGGSKKWLGFRGAMLAAGMMLGTTGTALAGTPASTQDKQTWVEHQKRVEPRMRVEVHINQPSRWDSRANDRAWTDHNARWRYEEQRRREAERRRQLAWRYHHQQRREYGTGGSGYSHRYDSWKRHGDPKHHQHRSDGSCYERKHDGKRRW